MGTTSKKYICVGFQRMHRTSPEKQGKKGMGGDSEALGDTMCSGSSDTHSFSWGTDAAKGRRGLGRQAMQLLKGLLESD